MAVATPSIQLPHQMHRSLGGGFVQSLQSSRPRLGSEEIRVGVAFGGVMLFQHGESANIAFSCNKNEKEVEGELIQG
jgi:hypothetical protein